MTNVDKKMLYLLLRVYEHAGITRLEYRGYVKYVHNVGDYYYWRYGVEYMPQLHYNNYYELMYDFTKLHN